ncbi:MAG: GDCCVxC domain-containing (seleno)protein [Hyphomicrobiales bacterium]
MDEEMQKIALKSVLTCPECGYAASHEMPENACAFFHECEGCGIFLKPLEGDCCVFCSYGTVPCPPIQAGAGCGD